MIYNFWLKMKNAFSGQEAKKIPLDYSLKKGQAVWFTFRTYPKKEDWIKAEILDLNWAYKSAAIKLEGYSGVFSTGIEALHRDRRFY